MSSNIEIKKKCKWCGQIFIARKTTTNYCSHRCNNAAYKERIRQERIATYQKEFSIKTEKPSIEDKEFYTPPEAAKLLRISRASIYRYMADNIIKVVQFKGKTLVRRKDIELLFENAAEYKKRVPIEKAPITDFYTTAEVKEKYHVNESWIFVVAKKNNIPRTFNRGKTYWSKKHIDAYFAQESPESRHYRMVQLPRNAGEVRHDPICHLLFRFQECHPQEERGHHGVLFQEARRYSQGNCHTRRTAILYGSRSDGEVQPHS